VPLSNNFEFEIKLFQILARIQTTLLSFLFKNFSIIKRIINKETLKLYAVQTYLRITSAALLPSFSNFFAFIFLKSFCGNLNNLAKMKYIRKKSSNQEIFAISLSSCSRYNATFKFDPSVFAIHDSPQYLWDQWR
jgi:hypothetical protein